MIETKKKNRQRQIQGEGTQSAAAKGLSWEIPKTAIQSRQEGPLEISKRGAVYGSPFNNDVHITLNPSEDETHQQWNVWRALWPGDLD